MTSLRTTFDVRWALAQRSAVGDLSAAIPTTGVALSLLLLTTQALPQRAATRLVRVNMQVKRFMVHWRLPAICPKLYCSRKSSLTFSFTQGARVLALRLDSERLQASSQACLAR